MWRPPHRLACAALSLAALVRATSAAESSSPGLSIIFGKDTDARGTVVCDKPLGVCATGFNAFFYISTPADPLHAVMGGASYSINDGPWQIGESIQSSEQFHNAELGGVAECPEGQWCQRFTWTHSATYQMDDALPVEMCFKIWAVDLSAAGSGGDSGPEEGRPSGVVTSEARCFYYTTPLEPHTREQVTGPATALFLSPSPSFSAHQPVLAYPLVLPTSAFPPPDLSDHASFQVLCSDGGCRSVVHVPLLVFPSHPLDQVSVFGSYALDDATVWTPGGVAKSQGILYEVPGLASNWSQLWTWDLSLPQRHGRACIRLFAADRSTRLTAPAGPPFCFHFADLAQTAAFTGAAAELPGAKAATMMTSSGHSGHSSPRLRDAMVVGEEEEEEEGEPLDKTPFIEGIAALSGLFVAVALIATTYTRRQQLEQQPPRSRRPVLSGGVRHPGRRPLAVGQGVGAASVGGGGGMREDPSAVVAVPYTHLSDGSEERF